MAAVLAAGCAGPQDEQPPEPEPTAGPALSGFVVDPAFRPLAGATVTAASNATATTDASGAYRFDGLAREVPVLLTAELEGFVSVSKSVTLPAEDSLRVNFTLTRVPAAEPYAQVMKFDGFLPCQVRSGGDGGGGTTECGALLGQERQDIWEFAVGPDLGGIVIEVVWEAATPAATLLNVTVETVGLGDQDAVLASVQGPSILRAQVGQAHAETYYPAGGIVRVVVSVGSDDDEEAGASAGAALNQDFQVFATAFYHGPPPPTYSVAG